ncbi:MAG: putative toxin-antitoxin system toxin component, PIN family [Spirosoma sp.]|nr:putative toxin-antitoxin system toxin component, PIN family [Spirosoma sp.]
MNQPTVLDTNTLVSTIILPRSVPARAYQKAIDRGELVVSESTLAELYDVLQRSKFDKYVSLEKRLFFYAELAEIAIHVPITHTSTACRDPKDNKFLELALSASASFIISGDSDLLILHPFQGVAILSPADYLLN